MENNPKKSPATTEDAAALENAVRTFRDANLIGRMEHGDIQNTSIDNAQLSLNAKHHLQVSVATKDGLIASETIGADGKPSSEVMLSASTLDSLKPNLRQEVVRGVEHESAALKHPLSTREQLVLDEMSAKNLIAVTSDNLAAAANGAAGGKQPSLMPDEAVKLQSALQAFARTDEFHDIANVPPGMRKTSSVENISLGLNAQHHLEVTTQTRDGLHVSQTFGEDGKPTSDLTLTAPSLAKLSPEARKTVIDAVEVESRNLHKPLDGRHELALEEKNAQALLAVSHDQASASQPLAKKKAAALPPR